MIEGARVLFEAGIEGTGVVIVDHRIGRHCVLVCLI